MQEDPLHGAAELRQLVQRQLAAAGPPPARLLHLVVQVLPPPEGAWARSLSTSSRSSSCSANAGMSVPAKAQGTASTALRPALPRLSRNEGSPVPYSATQAAGEGPSPAVPPSASSSSSPLISSLVKILDATRSMTSGNAARAARSRSATCNAARTARSASRRSISAVTSARAPSRSSATRPPLPHRSMSSRNASGSSSVGAAPPGACTATRTRCSTARCRSRLRISAVTSFRASSRFRFAGAAPPLPFGSIRVRNAASSSSLSVLAA